MGQEVNPPPQILLPKALSDMGIEVINYFQQQARFDLQLWNRTGAGEDFIDDAGQNITSSNSRVSSNIAKIDALEDIAFDVEIITSDFTTFRNQIIICKNTASINVTLDPKAIEEDTVHIKRTDAVVDVIGTIDGFIDKRINIKFFSLHLVFNGTDWSQI